MFNFLMAAVLCGNISMTSGRIGVKLNGSKIIHVYSHSSAAQYLKVGDRVVSSDDRGGTHRILGPVGSYCHLVITREGKQMEFYIPRVDWKEVKD